MKLGTPVVALLLILAAASSATGSEESQALGAHALVESHAGRLREALDLLDRAVAADPGDATIRYQRGVTRASMGDFSGAVDDFRAALAAKPDFPQAALELGIALTEAEQYEEAMPWLTQAQQDAELDAQASFFLGLAELRTDRFDEARVDFARARERDPALAPVADYYEGVIAYRRRDFEQAAARFTAVAEAAPESPVGRESARFLAIIRRGQPGAYTAFGTVALEYDSNVTLGPPDTTVPSGITGKGDGRVSLAAGGTYVPWRSERLRLTASYEFFQSLQFHLADYDLQDNRPALQLTADLDPVLIGVLGSYDYYLLSTDSFLQEATANPWVEVREPGIGRTELFSRMQWRDYKQLSFGVLNGFYVFAGLRQLVELGAPDRQLWLGYQYGFECPVNRGSDLYSYASQQAEVALRWPLPYEVLGTVGYRYEHQNYDSASAAFPPTGEPRRDNDSRVLVSFERPLPLLGDHFFANATYYGTFNDSNKTAFAYNRQIGALGLEVRF